MKVTDGLNNVPLDFRLSSYQYELPKELIAQEPKAKRSTSRLLVLDRKGGLIRHMTFSDLPDLLSPKDLLVVNDTKVFKARLFCKKADTSGKVELLLLRPTGREAPSLWRARGRLREGQRLVVLDQNLEDTGHVLRVVSRRDDGNVTVAVEGGESLDQLLERYGRVPLPPYIRRSPTEPADRDVERYQTVFARKVGAVAAPTAGFHFDQELLQALEEKGIEIAKVTLHVGPGTFKPIRDEDIRRHVVDPEWFELSEETASAINRVKDRGGRVVAVGTTVVRVLETVGLPAKPRSGVTHLYILPGHRFKVVDALVTNFHLPGTSLLVLVSAFATRELVLRAYREAVSKRYRFYSYGDAMLIL